MAIESVGSSSPLHTGAAQRVLQQETVAVPAAGGNAEPDVKEKEPVTAESVRHAVDAVNSFIGSQGTQLNFTVDDDTRIRVVKVIDKETKEVIRQIPAEEVVSIAKALDKLQGLLIRQTA